MKLKAYHSFIVFAILMMSAIFSSISSYHRMQDSIIADMDQALVITIHENKDQWITPDTIQSYRSHLNIDLLKENSILCYVVEDKSGKRKGNGYQPTSTSANQLSSKEMQLNQHSIQGYANCSMADVFGMSNQRTPITLSLMAMLWAVWSVYYFRRKNTLTVSALSIKNQEDATRSLYLKTRESSDKNLEILGATHHVGTMNYSKGEDSFYNQESGEAIKFTPMQHQLMQLFFENPHHKLSKQEICEALWPKKPDASETLYTLIRRIKPVIEQNSNLMIESERGRAYSLVIR